MERIKWYGPAIVVAVTAFAVMVLGPSVVRQIAHAGTAERIEQTRKSLQDPTLEKLSQASQRVAEAVEPSVVAIQVFARQEDAEQGRMPERFRRWFFGPDSPFGPRGEDRPEQPDEEEYEQYDVPRQRGNGSGWIYDSKGHIVTNHHVVREADKIQVRFHDGTEREAEVVGADAKTDIAVLKVDGGPLHPAARATEKVHKGEIVYAFGSPFRFEFSVSQGIVSATGRQLRIVAGGRGYENFIQTDAAINPGNSGGPLTNIHGEVVGMNTAIASRTRQFGGIGFAIPIKMANNVVTEIIEKGKVTRGYLGVYIEELEPQMAESFGFEGEGVLVTKPIPGTPAAKAGLERGDIITRFDGEAVDSTQKLRMTVAAHEPGSTVTVTVFRGGETKQLEVTIGELPEQPSVAAGPSRDEEAPKAEHTKLLKKLGFESLVPFTAEMAQQLEEPDLRGVLVRSVRRNSVVASEGITPRSVITHVMGEPVTSVRELATALGEHDLAKKPVRVSFVRKNPRSGELISQFALLKLPEQ